MSDMPPPMGIERILAISRAVNIFRDLHGLQPLCYAETGTEAPPPLSPGRLRTSQLLAQFALGIRVPDADADGSDDLPAAPDNLPAATDNLPAAPDDLPAAPDDLPAPDVADEADEAT
jgi:hypothetical protein